MSKKALFAAGCFWGVEKAFREVPGVLNATVGYSGGHTVRPSYEQVCSGDTGHAETIQIEFDPQKVSYHDLVRVFFRIHDPTTLNRQGVDVGTQYRSAIFYMDETQKEIAQSIKNEIEKSSDRPIVTEITPAADFFEAEEYHQRYLEKHKH